MRTMLKGRLSLLFLTFALMLAMPAAAFALEAAPGDTSSTAPTIQSDKDDYPPGGTVVLTGQNWQPGETVHINVNDDEGQTWNRNVDVTADENGAIRDEFQLPNWFVATYNVTATGTQSGTATTSFTDGSVRVRAVGTGGASAPVSWALYNNTTCSGSPTSSGSINAVTGGNGTDVPGGALGNQSLRLTAGTVGGATFSSWTNGNFTTGGFTPTSNPGCLIGSNGTQNTQVNYQSATIPVPSGALGWWPGDGTAEDVVGGNHGTLQGATYTAGKVGQAFNFDSPQDHVKMSSTALDRMFSALTMEAWVYPTNHGGYSEYGRTVISKTNDDGFALRVYNGYVQGDLRSTGGLIRHNFTQQRLPLNTWSHIALTYDGSSLKGYLNGQQLGSVAASGTITNARSSSTCLVIGNEADGCALQPGPGYEWAGALDEVGFYDRALSAAEISSIVAADSKGKIKPVNDAPTASAQSVSTDEDTAKTITLSGSDADGDNMTFSTVAGQGPANGSLGTIGSVSCTGTAPKTCSADVAYTPNANFNGSDSFKFRVNDGTVNSADATVSITVNAVNDAPSFDVPANATPINEDAGAQSVSGFVTNISAGPANESGQTVSFSNVTNNNNSLFTSGGQPAISSNGTLTYTPAANASGSATVSVQAKDSGGTANGGADTSATKTFTITVNAVNDAPTISNIENQTMLEDGNTGDLAFTVSDVDNNDGSLTVSGGSSDTTLVPNANVTFAGSGGSRTVKVTPAANRFGGPATVTVTVSDGDKSATDTFDLNVTPVNDAPSFTNGADQAVAEDAGAQSKANFLTSISAGPFETQTVTFGVTNDNNALFSAQPQISPSGTLTYKPADNAHGSATVTVKATDDGGTANGGQNESAAQMFRITVTSVNDAPTADDDSATTDEDTVTDIPVLNGDSDVDGDGLSVSSFTQPEHGTVSQNPGGTLEYTPAADYHGADYFTYRATDGSLDSNTARVSITVRSVNDRPVAKNQSVETDEDISKQITLEGADVDGDNLTYAVVSGPSHGNISGAGANRTYTPNANYNGPDSFTFKVNDGALDSDTATVSITVRPVNDAPAADARGPYTVNEGGSAPLDGSGSDVDGDTLTYDWDLDNNGSFETSGKTPNFSAASIDGPATRTVTLRVSDGNGGTDTSSATVNIKNVAPTATFNKPDEVNEGSDINLSLSAPHDPASADTFEYAFDCGDGYGVWGSQNSATCSTTDDGTRQVGARIRDDDGGVSEYIHTVTIRNVAPSVELSGPNTADEGDTKTYTYTVSDPGDDTFTVAATYPKCGTDGVLVAGSETTSASGGSFQCSFPDGPATTNVAIKVVDSDGASDTASEAVQIVAVANVTPNVTAPAGQSADEGNSTSFDLGSFTDPGPDNPWSVDVDWGDGSTHGSDSRLATGSLGTMNHTYADGPATRTVKITVTDKNGSVGTASFQVTVRNVAPTVTLDPDNSLSADEGSTHTYDYTISDPGVDTVDSVSTSCGANGSKVTGSDTYTNSSGSFECAFPDGTASSTVSARATDSDGDAGNTDTQSVAIKNVAPTVTFTSGSTNPNENKNGSETYSFSVSDPGNDGFTPGSPDCGIGGSLIGSVTPTANGGSFDCRFSDGPATPTVSMKVRDADEPTGSTTADSNTATRNVTVNNVAPKVNLTGANTADEGDTKAYDFTITDPGADTFHFPTGYPTCGAHGDLVGTPAIADGQFQCFFPDGDHTTDVAVKAADDDGGVSTADIEHVEIITVQISNVAPSVTAPANQGASEGQSKSFGLGSFSDPGPDSPWAVDVDWGDGSGHATFDETAAGPASAKAITARSHTYDDNGSYTVTVEVTDKNGASDTETFTVNVANAVPTADLGNNGPVNEGSPVTVSFSNQSDPSTADTNAGFRYAFACDNGSLAGATYAGSAASASKQCSFADNGNYTMRARIIDKDGGYTEKTTDVTVNNATPAVTKPADDTGVEGTSKSFGLGSFSDAGVNDNPWHVEVTWGDGSPAHEFDTNSQGGLGMANHKYADNGTYSVTVTVTDKDGASDTKTSQITINNSNPSISPISDTTANEGSSKSYPLGSFLDLGANDGPWKAKVDWGDGSPVQNLPDTSLQGSLGSESHTYNDNGSYTVTVSVTDKDNGTGSQTYKVNVANVAPTARFDLPSADVNEGDSFQLSLSNPSDVSNPDTAAGFEYRFDCGSGYGAWGSSSSANCPTNDNGVRSVKAQIRDKDGGVSEYTGNVSVLNVAPTITNVTSTSQNVLAGTANNLLFTGTATDPSTLDTNAGFSWQWSLNGGAYGPFGNANTFRTSFTGCGPQTVSARATDKDGGVSAPFTTNPVNVYNGAYKAPLVDGTVNKVQKGQVVPVKISVGCGTTNLTGLIPHIQLLNGNQSPENEVGGTAVTTSVSSADTGQTMRPVDGGYIYNLRVPSDSTATAGKQYTIRVNPFGESAVHAATGMYIVIEIRK